MSVRRIVTAIVAGCAGIVVSAVPGIAAQIPPAHQHAAAAKAQPASAMDAKCQAMMAGHEKMMADLKANDQRLDELVATMNAASGTEKMAATARVVTEKVTQDRAMRDGMMKMQHDMMGHMMEHMQAGKESMAGCPMMKQMSGMK
jgi:septal ring factor EnvC (AmiA/AmiB activator)